MPKATQIHLPLPTELRLPTLTLSGARTILGLHENVIKGLIDTGAISSWDIARQPGERREFRLLAASVKAWGSNAKFTDEEIIKLVYGIRPGERPSFLYGSWFCRCWNCDSGHMINLVADKTLALLPKTDYGRGRGNTPCITWESALAFLRNRRIQ